MKSIGVVMYIHLDPRYTFAYIEQLFGLYYYYVFIYHLILQVYTNGIVSLGIPYFPSYIRPFPFKIYRIIAPFWDDVDTRGTGKIFYRQTTDPNLLARASHQIQAGNLSLSQNVTNLVIVTWDAVGYYPNRTDKVNWYTVIVVNNLYTVVCESFNSNKVSWVRSTVKIKHMKFFHVDY